MTEKLPVSKGGAMSDELCEKVVPKQVCRKSTL